jgi:indole-3-glycerol phosphate synthase
MTILDRIMQERRRDVDAARARVPEDALRRAAAARTPLSLARRLCRPGPPAVIAEVKKASPSAGVLQPDYQPARLARAYVDAGAAAISVLTEPHHFLGSADDLRAVRAAVDVPILRKDFLCDPYQVAEAAAWGADVVLLIAAALDDTRLRVLYDTARAFGLEVLAEAHTAEEVDRVLALPEAIVGVNSRDLKTLHTDLAVARRLAGRIPPDRTAVAESGIRTRADLLALQARRYAGFLVGESLLRAGDVQAKLGSLLGDGQAEDGAQQQPRKTDQTP